MSAAASLAKSGKLILVISIVVFIAALVVLLMTQAPSKYNRVSKHQLMSLAWLNRLKLHPCLLTWRVKSPHYLLKREMWLAKATS